jgi:DNA-binding MarR family transcriptional regulator
MDNPESDFVRTLGLPFLAHLLRRLSDRMVAEAGDFEDRLGIRAPPRTASTMLMLRIQGPKSVTEISEQLRQSHPLVISWIKQLSAHGLVTRSSDPVDRRRTLVALTPAGEEEAARMAAASPVIGEAYGTVLAEADAHVFDALWRLHDLLVRGRLTEELRLASTGPAFRGKAPSGLGAPADERKRCTACSG